MSYLNKQKTTSKKTKPSKYAKVADTSNKSPYSKQNIRKKFNEFGDKDAI